MQILARGVQVAEAGLRLLGVKRRPTARPESAYDRGDDLGVSSSRSAMEGAVAVAEAGVVGQLRPGLQALKNDHM